MRFQMGSADRACFTQAGKHKFKKKNTQIVAGDASPKCMSGVDCCAEATGERERGRERERVGYHIITM
jgi:hypothetical protein